jgi:hypothetical protein
MTTPTIMETAPDLLGTKRPNLVTTKDSAWDQVQFRVQCEVWLNPSDAARVEEAIMPGRGRNTDAIDIAEKIVLENVAEGANSTFYKIISLAFADLRNA